MDRAEFETALEAFRAASEEAILAHYARNDFTFAVPDVEIGKGGKRYRKLWNIESYRDGERHNRGIHAFVEIATGDIFKPASCKAPAKHKRGNIYEDAGRACLTEAGHVAYMR